MADTLLAAENAFPADVVSASSREAAGIPQQELTGRSVFRARIPPASSLERLALFMRSAAFLETWRTTSGIADLSVGNAEVSKRIPGTYSIRKAVVGDASGARAVYRVHVFLSEADADWIAIAGNKERRWSTAPGSMVAVGQFGDVESRLEVRGSIPLYSIEVTLGSRKFSFDRRNVRAHLLV